MFLLFLVYYFTTSQFITTTSVFLFVSLKCDLIFMTTFQESQFDFIALDQCSRFCVCAYLYIHVSMCFCLYVPVRICLYV